MMLYAPGAMDQLHLETVAELQVGGAGGDSLKRIYDPQFSIQLFRLEYPTRDISAVPGVREFLRLRETLRSATVVYNDVPLGIYAMDEGGHAIVAVRRSQLILPLPAGASAVSIPLGIVSMAYSGGQRCDGCEMNIYAVRRDAAGRLDGQLLFSRKLDPQHILTDRGPQLATTGLPAGQIEGILLETSPMGAAVNSYSYWGQPVFVTAQKSSP
jgi:hypothetical protein